MWYPAQATSSLMRYFTNITDLKSIRLASVYGAYTNTNGIQWIGRPKFLRCNTSFQRLQLDSYKMPPLVSTASQMFSPLGQVQELQLSSMDASGILLLFRQVGSRALWRLEVLVLQDLVNCNGDTLYSAILNLVDSAPHSWCHHKCVPRISSIEIIRINGVSQNFWDMLLDLFHTYNRVTWSLEQFQE